MIDSRHIESASKDLPKLFPFSATVTPWNERTSKAIAEHEQGDIEVEKEQAGIFCKLQDIKSNVNNLKETLKYYEQTNEFLVKVQRLTEVAAQKMDQFKVNMANCYE